jgi:hypothetical protein
VYVCVYLPVLAAVVLLTSSRPGHRSSSTTSLVSALPSFAILTFALTLEEALGSPKVAQASTPAAPDKREKLVV